MNDNNNNTQVSNVSNNTIDPRTINAEVIGELRKDKIGRPILVIEMFIIFAIVLIGLPIVTKLMANENSFLYKIIHPNEVVSPVNSGLPIQKSEFANGGELQQLNAQTSMKFENIVMKNFSLKGDTINLEMYSYNGVLNLDEKAMFLEVYASRSENKIAAVKLVGTFDNQRQSVSLRAHGLSFNANYGYVGKVVEMEENDYPVLDLKSDEAGKASLVCTMDERTIEYTFKNNYLININDTVRVKFMDGDNTSYLNAKKNYEDKAMKLGTNALVEEVSDGFLFNANINLETYTVPANIIDYNYFKGDTLAKVIDYTMKGKGFDCK